MSFGITAFFNPFLPVGQQRLDAVLTIRSDTEVGAGSAAGGRRVFGFIIDASGSMAGEKLAQAKLATRRGIEKLGDADQFFVVSFASDATVVVAACNASAANKSRAHEAVQHIATAGSTKMSRGLSAARSQVAQCGAGVIASTYLLTDGENDGDDHDNLRAVVEQCVGAFQCHCRGVGTAWKPDELRHISNRLLGTADAVPDASGLEEDLRAFIAGSMSKGIAGATLRLWSPKVVKVGVVRQMSPEILDLMPLARRIDDKTLELPLGAWGAEVRDYQLAFELPVGAIGDEVLACRAALVYQGPEGEVKVACDPVAVKWSADDALTTRIAKEVAHYTGQSELASSIEQGLAAKAGGNEEVATRLLGRAVQIAESTGNEEVTRRLRKVVDVVDAGAGTVRLRKSDKAADMALELGATRTVRRRSSTTPDATQA